MPERTSQIAIVDYGLGNLYSVQRACAHVGLTAAITASPADVENASGIILPGVGAMPTAMQRLRETGLATALVSAARRGTPVFGICLGLQLLMKDGSEFEPHEGLGLIAGRVVRFEGVDEAGKPLKVPHIGWNGVFPHAGSTSGWAELPIEDLDAGAMMYFVHSYYVQPADPADCVAIARYGSVEFCAAVASRNIFACQFHPERSGAVGLSVYARFARMISQPALAR